MTQGVKDLTDCEVEDKCNGVHDVHSVLGGLSANSEDRDIRECCWPLINSVINIMGHVLCIRKMSRFVRIGLLWLYVLTVVLTVGLLLGLRILGTNEYQAAPTDMRKVNEKINNAFCQSLDLSSSKPFTAFVLGHEPNVDTNSSEQYSATYHSQLVKHRDYKNWGFYFIEGSNITIRSKTSSHLTKLYVIKNTANLKRWKDDQGDCDSCYITKESVFANNIYTLNVTERGSYFFGYSNGGSTSASVTAHVYIQRKLFDVSDASSTCVFNKNDAPCKFDLSLSPHQSVVVQNGKSRDTDITIVTKCYARSWLYFIVFVLIPVAIGLLLSIILWKFCKDEKGEEKLEAKVQFVRF